MNDQENEWQSQGWQPAESFDPYEGDPPYPATPPPKPYARNFDQDSSAGVGFDTNANPYGRPQPFPLQPYPGAKFQPYSQQQPYPMQQMYGPPFVSAPIAAPYGIEPTTGRPYSEKSKIVAGLLQIFLGAFGVGRFYKGDVGVGLAQLILNFTVGWVTLGATLLWPLIDGIIMMAGNPTDREGRPLRG